MAGRVAPYVDNTGLAFAYDQSNTVRSYLGEPTTNNYGSNFRDFTGTGYSIDGEWTSDPTRFTKTYFANLPTPIGPGATLIEESGVNGFHHLSRYGGGSESGAHSLSCYLYPLATGITDFCIGMLGDGSNNIQFNLDTRAITYGGGIQNRNAFIRDVPGWPGWIRVGANIEGRTGGWVGCFGYSSYTWGKKMLYHRSSVRVQSLPNSVHYRNPFRHSRPQRLNRQINNRSIKRII